MAQATDKKKEAKKPAPKAAPKKEAAKPAPAPPKPAAAKLVVIPPFIKALVDKMGEKVANLDNQIRTLVEVATKEKVDAKVVHAQVETILANVDQMGNYLGGELAKMHDLGDGVNPLVQVTSVNIVRGLRTAARQIENAPSAPSAYLKSYKDIKEAAKSIDAICIVMTGAGVADTVRLPGSPLLDGEGKALVDGLKG